MDSLRIINNKTMKRFCVILTVFPLVSTVEKQKKKRLSGYDKFVKSIDNNMI